jgi:hypothetical protein
MHQTPIHTQPATGCGGGGDGGGGSGGDGGGSKQLLVIFRTTLTYRNMDSININSAGIYLHCCIELPY